MRLDLDFGLMPVSGQTASDVASTGDEWRTPPVLFAALDAVYHFELDAAATRENALCEAWYTKEMDALWRSWHGLRVFLNPPYARGLIDRFVTKAADEAERGALVVAVLRGDFSTSWFWEVKDRARDIVFCRPRFRFVLPDGETKQTPTFGTAIAVFSGRRRSEPLQVSWWDWKHDPFPAGA
jgi:site-specific DNA-methyltransferase (adenine-specific)